MEKKIKCGTLTAMLPLPDRDDIDKLVMALQMKYDAIAELKVSVDSFEESCKKASEALGRLNIELERINSKKIIAKTAK